MTMSPAYTALLTRVPPRVIRTDEQNEFFIAALYELLARVEPSPVVDLNRAVAIAMRDGPAAGLERIDIILARGDLADYHLAHAARADLCRRLGRTADARVSYERALTLVKQEPERRFLVRRLREMG